MLKVTFHGVRGSTPCQSDDVRRYGGNTSCVSVVAPGEDPVVFDLGTGLRYFGFAQPTDGTFRGTCLLTHLHWDHTQGLPFFVPVLREGAQFDIYGPTQEPGGTVESAMRRFMAPPHFPVTLDQLPGEIRFHDVGDEDFRIGGFAVRSRLIPHVGNTLGFRLAWNGLSVAYLSDHQQPLDGSYSMTRGARELVEGVDLLIHDAQYTPPEFELKRTWGHCTMEYAVWLAANAGAKRLALFHHDPSRTDDELDELFTCLDHGASKLGLELFVAREGACVELGPA